MREGRIRTHAVFLATCDTLMVLLAMQIAWWLRFDFNAWLWQVHQLKPFGEIGFTPYQPYFLAVFITLPLFWLILREMGLYSQPEDGAGEFFRLCAAVGVSSVLLAAISFYVKQQHADQQFQYSRGYMLLFVPAGILCLALGRRAVPLRSSATPPRNAASARTACSSLEPARSRKNSRGRSAHAAPIMSLARSTRARRPPLRRHRPQRRYPAEERS